MNNCTYKFLYLSNFKDIPNWSVQYAEVENLGFTKKYPMARIGSFLAKSQDTIFVQDDVAYKQVTIKINNGGVVPRNNGATLKGNKIGTKRQKIVHTGQFIMSKIDARNGAYGIVPEELDGAIVTNDFPVFDVDDSKILPQFLVLVSTTDRFIEFARKCSSGTTNRKRIDIDAFLQQKIPLPSLEEQNALLEAYNASIVEADKKFQESRLKEEAIYDFLTKRLGIKDTYKPKHDNGKYMTFSSLSKLSRWDSYNQHYTIENRGNTVPLGKLIKSKPVYGAPYSATQYNYQFRYIRITDINEDGSLSDELVSADNYNKSYRLNENDFLIARSGNTVGKTFLYQEQYGPAIFAGYLIRFEINEDIILPQYLLFYTKSSIFKKWIVSNMRISAQPNINSKQYLDAPIIVPSMSIQKEIVRYAHMMRNDSMKLRDEASRIKRNAYITFYSYIFE